MKKYALIALMIFGASAQAAPNYMLEKGTTVCKHLRSLSVVARIEKDEYVTEVQRSEASNDCTVPMTEDKPVVAVDIGVTAKVWFFALGQLDVYYANERDLISLSEDKPKL